MKKVFRTLWEIVEPRNAVWKAIIFLVIPTILFFAVKFAFDPLDKTGMYVLRFAFSFFYSIGSFPKGIGVASLLVLLLVFGIWLRYEEKTGRYFFYRFHQIPYIGFLFPAAKSFQFQPCVFWASESDRRPAAYRGRVTKNGKETLVVVDIVGFPSVFGLTHWPQERFVILLNLPSSKLLSSATTGGTTLPSPEDIDPIPWPDETKEEAQKRYDEFPR